MASRGDMEFWLRNFDSCLDRGLAAKDKGDNGRARTELLRAAEYLLKLAANTPAGRLKSQRVEQAEELLQLAQSLPKRSAVTRKREQRPGAAEKDRPITAGDDDGTPPVAAVHDPGGTTFKDIAGLQDVKEQIRLRMIYPFTHPDKARHFGLKVGGGILLYGPPGTGKTLIARATANELKAAFYVVKPSEIMSKWVGEAEKNVQALFAEARTNPLSVIFIDEIEALVPSRKSNQSTVMKRVVPQFLAELEGFDTASKNPILFVGATNVPWEIDDAVMRPGRFDCVVYVGLPDERARRQIWEANLLGRPLAPDVTLDELVGMTDGYSGADIRAICERGAQDAFLDSVGPGSKREGGNGGAPVRFITQAHLLAAVAAVPRSVNEKLAAQHRKFRASREG